MTFSWMMKKILFLVCSASTVAFAGNTLHFQTGAVSTGIQALSVGQQASIFQKNSTQYFVVQYDRHVSNIDKKQLENAGLKVLSYFPDDAYIVKTLRAPSLNGVQGIKTVVPFLPQFKISPHLGVLDAMSANREERVVVQLFEASDLKSVHQQVRAMDVGKVHFAKGKARRSRAPKCERRG